MKVIRRAVVLLAFALLNIIDPTLSTTASERAKNLREFGADERKQNDESSSRALIHKMLQASRSLKGKASRSRHKHYKHKSTKSSMKHKKHSEKNKKNSYKGKGHSSSGSYKKKRYYYGYAKGKGKGYEERYAKGKGRTSIGVQSFVLVDAGRNIPLLTINNGDRIDVRSLYEKYGTRKVAFECVTYGNVKSVVMSSGSGVSNIDNHLPWTLLGDFNGNYFGISLKESLGDWSITCQPYSWYKGTGIAGAVQKVEFVLLNGADPIQTITPTSAPAPFLPATFSPTAAPFPGMTISPTTLSPTNEPSVMVSTSSPTGTPGALLLDWDTSQSGVIAGSGGWSIPASDGTVIRFDLEDSVDCGGPNSNVQAGTATASIELEGDTLLSVDIEGLGGAAGTISPEIMTVLVDGVIVSSASPEGSERCAGASLVQNNVFQQPLLLRAGTRAISLSFTSRDNLFHQDAFYEARFVFQEAPAISPTNFPSIVPTRAPSASSSGIPTSAPDSSAASDPTVSPTAEPTNIPTMTPFLPSTEPPTAAPIAFPTAQPTLTPTEASTSMPTSLPTSEPTLAPVITSTIEPTDAPTTQPTDTPTAQPTTTPTSAPILVETDAPTGSPAAELVYGLQPDCYDSDPEKFNICLDISSESGDVEEWFPLMVQAKERWERIIAQDR